MRCNPLILLAITALAGFPLQAEASSIDLGTAGSFAVLAGSGVTNTGPTKINGDVGLYPTPSITGFLPGIVNGTIYAADDVALTAQNDLTTAYTTAAGLGGWTDLTDQDLGTVGILTPGVYRFSSDAL